MLYRNYFILDHNNNGFELDVKNKIKTMFSELNADDLSFLHKLLIDLINYISVYFGWNIHENNSPFTKQYYIDNLSGNDYKDIIALLNLLLPFINDPTDDKKKKLKSLSEIYITKIDDNMNSDEYINTYAPKYEYSNIQYNRCDRTNQIKERHIEHEDINMNYILLKETIVRIANKLFLNWSHIYPFTLDTIIINDNGKKTVKRKFEESVLYHNTEYLLKTQQLPNHNHLNIIDDIRNPIHSYHLYIGHIYDNLIHNLYHNIKKWRWILYDIIDNEDKVIDETDNQHLPIFGKIINVLELNPINSNEIKAEKIEILKYEILHNYTKRKYVIIIKAIVTYYESITGVKLDEIEEDLDDEYDNSKDIEIYIAKFKNITLEELSAYIITTLQAIKGTWFWYYFMNDDFTHFLTEHELHEKINMDGYSPKMIYNYAKLIANDYKQKNKVVRAPSWNMLDQQEKHTISNMLNNINNDWYKISNYLKIVYKHDNNIDVYKMQKNIYNAIRHNLVKIIFEVMIINGNLSYTYFNPILSNETTTIEQYRNEIHNNIIIDTYDKAFNFVNNEPFMYNLVSKYQNESVITQKYVEYFTHDRVQTTKMATLNWVSQIQFFHKYFNNRVIFVTGGTGVGKSSQVPKLVLYALKNISYKQKGKIICTQPTIAATISGAKNISNELGVQIDKILNKPKSIDNSIDKDDNEKTNNYVLQYESKDKTSSHITKYNGLSLKFCTDGILFKIIQNNPLLAKKLITNEQTKYIPKNDYDIIMIDESHTHNINMDLILSFAKYTTYYNNTIKLFIISATMDDDEPYYRRFYRDINDNRMYPFNVALYEGKTKDEYIDRIVVDRRYHVGSKLRFSITDIYQPDWTYLDAVQDIMLSNTTGDILLFQTGAHEILNAVTEINKIVPHNVLAIPLFGGMSKSDQEKITADFAKTRKIMINSKQSDLTKIEEGLVSPYNRFIIVATNIVEASITIDSLEYVIDNGFYKSMKYDYKIMGTVKNDKTLISEQSRLQRRGRVGRVAKGTVYYLYAKDSRKNIRHDFDIVTSDVSFNMFNLLSKSSQPIIDIKYDPNIPNNFTKINNIILDNTNQFRDFTKQFYTYKNQPYTYIGNFNYYDYLNSKRPNDIYIDGISGSDIFDKDGIFYIIHPEETNFIRNLQGTITNSIPNSQIQILNHQVESDKIQQLLNGLTDYLLITPSYNNNTNITKTKFGIIVSELEQIFMNFGLDPDITYGMIISYLYSRKYKCEYIIDIILLYMFTNLSPDKLFNDIITFFTPHNNIYGATTYYLENMKHYKILIDKGIVIPGKIYMEFNHMLTKIKNELNQPNILDKLHSSDTLLQVNITPIKEYNINLCFMHGFIHNIVMNIGNKYIKIIHPTEDNTVIIQPNLHIKHNEWDYIVFLSNKLTTIDLIHGLRESDVLHMNHIFNLNFIKQKINLVNTTNTNYIGNLKILKSRIQKHIISDNLTLIENIDDIVEYKNWIIELKKINVGCSSLFYIKK